MSIATQAGAYDPQTVWRTVESKNFRVHCPESRVQEARDIAAAAERALALLATELDVTHPDPIDIVLNDETDFANGFAQTLPYDLIGLNSAAPEDLSDLSYYDDRIFELVAHEMAHIVHIGTISGLPKILNEVLGRTFTPNGAQPRWLIEGLATYFESSLTHAGRVRSAYFDMMMRVAVLLGEPFDLGQITGFPQKWPQGSVAYLYGGRFLDYVARRFGKQVLRDISHAYGRRLIPLALNETLREVIGRNYQEIYEDFLSELHKRYSEQRAVLERQPLIEGKLLTNRGQKLGPARWYRDNAIVYVEAPLGEHARLMFRDVDGLEREVAWIQSGATIAVDPVEPRVYVAQADVYDTYYLYSDVYAVDVVSGKTTRLTHGRRVFALDVAPTGNDWVVARNEGAKSVLDVWSAGDPERARTLVDFGPQTQVWTPRFSPDGTKVAFSALYEGQRDLWEVNVQTGQLQRLTNDTAFEGGPSYSSNGDSIIFHSDRTGVFNIYKMSATDEPLQQLSNVLGGAFYPELDPRGERLVYQSYGEKGFDLAELVPQPLELQNADNPPAWPIHVSPEVDTVERDYSAWPSVAPRAWFPVLTTDPFGSAYGLSLAGQDAVGWHRYLGQLWFGRLSRFLGFAASYVNQQFRPGISLDVSRALGFAALPYVRNGQSSLVLDDVWFGRVGTSWPLWARRDQSVTVGLSYDLTYRRPYQSLVFDPLDHAPSLPDEGRFGGLRLSLSLSNAQAYTNSISAEEGGRLDLGLRLEDPRLGAHYRSYTITADLSYFFENPFWQRHVVAANLFFGYGQSNYAQRKLFAIGGAPVRDVILDTVRQAFGSVDALRGLPLAPFAADSMLVAHLEYRAPFFDVEEGVDTLPLYLRAFHGALFIDGATLADRPRDLLEESHFTAGAEVRLGLLLGYGLPVTLRLGYGHGLFVDKQHQSFFLLMGDNF